MEFSAALEIDKYVNIFGKMPQSFNCIVISSLQNIKKHRSHVWTWLIMIRWVMETEAS